MSAPGQLRNSTRPVSIHVAPFDHPWHTDIGAAVQRAGAKLAAAEQAEGVIWLGKEGEGLEGLLHPGLRWIQLRSAGVENWAHRFDGSRIYTSARGVYAETVAEHVMALLLAAARRIPHNSRASSWDGAADRAGRLLCGSTVALLGAGAIGQAVIRYLEPFDVRILAVTRSGRDVPGASVSTDPGGLEGIWPEADHVVLSAPATAQTRHLVGAVELEAMRSHAWLINVGRGSLVDTDALVVALREDRIGGAALDVTDPEPLPIGHPLWSEPNVLITPHVANPPDAQREGLVDHVEANVRRFVAGQPLAGVVDVEAGY